MALAWRHYGADTTLSMEVNVYDRDDTRFMFARPGSALRAARKGNPRNLPCPTCKAPDRLTPADARRGYQCDACAARDEGGGW